MLMLLVVGKVHDGSLILHLDPDTGLCHGSFSRDSLALDSPKFDPLEVYIYHLWVPLWPYQTPVSPLLLRHLLSLSAYSLTVYSPRAACSRLQDFYLLDY